MAGLRTTPARNSIQAMTAGAHQDQDLRSRLLQALPDARVIARAPGRVNLIGEHTDYNGYGVLPFAIDKNVMVAIAPREDWDVTLRSIDSETYSTTRIPIEDIPIRRPQKHWSDYVMAALRSFTPRHGLEMVIAGEVPTAAGLSSSSALVVASMLALHQTDDRLQLADWARQEERYVGVLSGGMDQAASLLSEPGHALAIDFRPLRFEAVPMPEDLAVLVINSGIKAEKGGPARNLYNERVMECSTAARQLGAPVGGLLADVPFEQQGELDRIQDPVLRRRAGFVYAEAERRDAAVAAMKIDDIETLGNILSASHAGLRDDYEVSLPLIDELVDQTCKAGALGARIVGAGFGGCIVAVTRKNRIESIREQLGQTVMEFTPSAGAERIDLD